MSWFSAPRVPFPMFSSPLSHPFARTVICSLPCLPSRKYLPPPSLPHLHSLLCFSSENLSPPGIIYLFVCCLPSRLKCKLPEGGTCCGSQLYPQLLEQSTAHSRCSVNIYGRIKYRIRVIHVHYFSPCFTPTPSLELITVNSLVTNFLGLKTMHL